MKIQESVCDDEKLFREYFAAILSLDHGSVEEDSELAKAAVEHHRKLFPKKVARPVTTFESDEYEGKTLEQIPTTAGCINCHNDLGNHAKDGTCPL